MSIKLLRDQKEEYLEHLFEVMFEPVLHIFQETYDKSLQANPKNVLKEFQQELAKIPEWNQLQVEKAYQNIKCDYFGKLIKTVYILTIKTIMMGIPEDKRDKLKLRVPASDNFLHRCLIHMARELWKRPYLFYHLARSIERQNNIYNCEVILKKKIKAVIRETIPMNWVVEQLGGEAEEKESVSTSESEEEESESESSASEESESEAEEEEVSPEESESEGEEVEPEESSESEEEVEESDADDEDEDESYSESEVEAETEKIDAIVAPVDNEDEITIVESGYERSEETTTPSLSNEDPESPVEVIIPEVTAEPEQEPEIVPEQVPEPLLQNIVIPTDESKRVVYVEEPPKPLLKKKKPKHTFF